MTVLLISIFWNIIPVYSAGDFTITDVRVEHRFGERIEFFARVESDDPITEAEILYRSKGSFHTITGEAAITDDQLYYSHEVGVNPAVIPVFSMIEYRIRVVLKNGQTEISDWFEYEYSDNRFEWQSLADPPFVSHWIEGDTSLGQSVLDAARAGYKKAQGLIEVPSPQNLDIYVYPNGADLQSALQLSGFTLVAGHANPELGVMMVSLPSGPSQELAIQRQIPHELMHVLLYEKLGDRYSNVPVWLDEGIASLSEGSSNPDYYILIQDAIANDSILSIESMCGGFRLEAALFYLSYAQSESFTRYIYDNFGSSGLEGLLKNYADGVECTRAPEIVFGVTLNRLESDWYNEITGGSGVLADIGPLVPWFVILGSVILVPLGMVLIGLGRLRSGTASQQTLQGR